MSTGQAEMTDLEKAKAEVAKSDAARDKAETGKVAAFAKEAGGDQAVFVDRQATLAHERLQEAFRQIGQHLTATVDPRLAARTHPWTSLVVAAGTGLITGMLARKAIHAATTTEVPESEKTHYVVIPEGYKAVSAVDGKIQDPEKLVEATKPAKPSFLSGTVLNVVKMASEVIKPIILAQMSGHAAGAAADKATADVTDGSDGVDGRY